MDDRDSARGGGSPATRPDADLHRVAHSERRFEAALGALTDEDVGRPTPLLPGWTLGHLLTHVARNADSHRRRARAAARGESVEQYPGGAAARAAEIDSGARRPADELTADVRSSAEAAGAAWEDAPDTAWGVASPDVGGHWRTLASLPARRWQELEVHLVDLGLGPTPGDWSDDFVAVHLPLLRATLARRLPAGATAPAPGSLDAREELAWLYGRLERPDLPRLDGGW